jgi:hypothetical protein
MASGKKHTGQFPIVRLWNLSGNPTYQDLAASCEDNFRLADHPGVHAGLWTQARLSVRIAKTQATSGC